MRLRPLALALLLLVPSPPVSAQWPGTIHRIGYISNRPGPEAREEAFRERLRELGHVEGRDLVIEWRFAKGNVALHPTFTAELVGLNVDCIVAVGVAPTRAAKRATNTIPIVMADADDDPVRQGLVASLARPAGNVTGVISISSNLAGKRLELIKEAFPEVSRVAILYDPKGPGGVGHVRESEVAARAIGMQLQRVEVRGTDPVERAFKAARAGRAEALIVVATAMINSHRATIVSLAGRERLPIMYTNSDFVRAGGLMSYSADIPALGRRAATHVDKILRGAKPSDLPVEQPTKFELVVNLTTAKALGREMAPSVLARADRVLQ